MACTLTRSDVSDIVLDVLRQIHSNPSITEFSRFGIELMVDPFARATLYPGPITERIKQKGCFLKVFGPSDCQKAQDGEDIVTAAWNDVKSGQTTLALAKAVPPPAPTTSQPLVVQPAPTIVIPPSTKTKRDGGSRTRSRAKKGSAKKGGRKVTK